MERIPKITTYAGFTAITLEPKPQDPEEQIEQEPQANGRQWFQRSLENYIPIGEVTRTTIAPKLKKAKKKSTTAKLTAYGYGFKVKTTLNHSSARKSPNPSLCNTSTSLTPSSSLTANLLPKEFPDPSRPTVAIPISSDNHHRMRPSSTNKYKEGESVGTNTGISGVSECTFQMASGKRPGETQLTRSRKNQQAFERSRPLSRPKVQGDSIKHLIRGGLKSDSENPSREIPQKQEHTRFRTEKETNPDQRKENDLNPPREEAIESSMENVSSQLIPDANHSTCRSNQNKVATSPTPEKNRKYRDSIKNSTEPPARLGEVRLSSGEKLQVDFQTSPQGGHSRYIRGSSKDAPRISDFPPPPPHRLPEDILVQATLPPAKSPDTSGLSDQVSPENRPTERRPLQSNLPPQHSTTSRRRFSAGMSPDTVAASRRNEQAHQRLQSYKPILSSEKRHKKDRRDQETATKSNKFVILLRQAQKRMHATVIRRKERENRERPRERIIEGSEAKNTRKPRQNHLSAATPNPRLWNTPQYKRTIPESKLTEGPQKQETTITAQNKEGPENFITDNKTATTPTPRQPTTSKYQSIIHWPRRRENSSRESQNSAIKTDKTATITAQYKSVAKIP